MSNESKTPPIEEVLRSTTEANQEKVDWTTGKNNKGSIGCPCYFYGERKETNQISLPGN